MDSHAAHGVAWGLSEAAPSSRATAAAGAVAVIELPRPPGDAMPAAIAKAEDSQAAKLGRAVHRVLQWTTATQQAADLRALAGAAAAEFDLPLAAADVVSSYARTIRNSPVLQRFFDPARFVWSADEFDIVSDGEALRIDRLVRMGPAERPSWWVLDYKLAFDAAADLDLRRQLTRYRDAVQALAGDAPVHAAFVTGDGALHELQASDPAVE